MPDLSKDPRAIARAFVTQVTGRIGVAVSGGSDSLAALLLLHEAAPGRIWAATVDHNLRADSAAEAEMVQRFCAARDIAHYTLPWQPADMAGNLPHRARIARYSLLSTWAREAFLAGVVIAHNREDQAETYLMNLGRSAGIDGLSAMRDRWRVEGVPFYRPFMALSRKALRDVLRAGAISWVDDPTNDDPHYQRVRLRRLLPQLAEAGIETTDITRAALHLSQVSEALDWALTAAVGDPTTPAGEIVLPVAQYRSLPTAMRYRLLLRALDWIGGPAYPPRGPELTGLDQALFGASRRTLGGCLFTSGARHLRITREVAAVGAAVPAGVLFDGRWQLAGQLPQGALIGRLGGAIAEFPDWRASGYSRASLMAGPAIWQAQRLIAAPLLQPDAKWQAEVVRKFNMTPLSH
ncbi:tRNA lysidine(34) synthetase TilS [Ketogulonicigenium vulgare]|uniref:tRNA(Ile)-lysidine synthase n=1 Tax=Ketogulonicigenium vulgare (strain WSH-001) TaxID=759362 RepID=F9YAK1_KETVW|nr:tRNA lysidine(34) synthetase TilS [Ketogulonicigenium vulgare]ADO43238.1 Probable cell cycle protein [Ketogulonicigenium vulgare Y25]AEM41532.1 tRNA(Ile)-lysidine synthetase-like protein [Ketogulonicigenium vulgare WSH-001]ALJ81654.1 tRNA(Ile)-lysidine synthetase [Ketogulonicigenium vulgare]AOZ55274.1 cell cycle protein [Ketogulonicigenium vulgare]